ncbi:mechanosensitive ion channel protein MscL [Polaribacter reichenbachii]|uniref:Large-conductance mechanosensitive channel n=1 Tax=Polaribacter reichenbachii TaxID=996801 RepID=A0A1B8TUM6_9FLAO|nr:large conductance mechanosensitive channel protein MscL [Polaribacter reichenbachii]APZ45783.1 mechanosensitive ion channel protein MscL [Polaribacter reichenbachii]AUC19645.1 mechanosensitive ion channel protein MscL [Polaribacter reichenbachii]OBY63199.1 mechanosensitive ion channel protein MscL [Polaribacter reichenbachii]
MKFKLLQEFKDFAVKGNMIDIAIGVIIGTAFNKVVNVLVKEVLMPPLTLMTDGANWENKKFVLREAVLADGKPKIEEIAIGYGKLIEAGVDFLVIALTVFLVVKVMNKMKQKADDPKNKTVATPKNIELMNKTNELLEKQNTFLMKLLDK